MKTSLKVLFIDTNTALHHIEHYKIGDFFGPVDLGLHLSKKNNSLNLGTGLFAGSILSGSNRLIFTGNSPCWDGFYISTMGSAGLVFNNLDLSMISITGKSTIPSILYVNRREDGEIEVELEPINVEKVWYEGRGGVYSLMEYALEHYANRYTTDPRVLATGPSAQSTDFGAICSAPLKKGQLTFVDTWAGRGGFGSKLFQEHGVVAIIYGGATIKDGFKDNQLADQLFMDQYQMTFAQKDKEATKKYRYEPTLKSGGTFGVNYSTLGGNLFSFNYKSIYMSEDERIAMNDRFVTKHYLKQFNEETIEPKSQKNCGEPCVAVCKKMHGEFKKDYEPYQTMGPLSGIFDQRAAEKLNHHADMYGFDAISIGGLLSWLMEGLYKKYFTPEELGVENIPDFSIDTFDVVASSMHNANIGIALLDSIIKKRGILNLQKGTRQFVHTISKSKGTLTTDSFVYTANGKKGWMVPNQYWTPGVLSPMAIMGKYYMYYGQEFIPPRELGRKCAARLKAELIMDNTGVCRFHRAWAEEMTPTLVGSLYGLKNEFLENINKMACHINANNSSVYWQSQRNIDIVYIFLKRKYLVENNKDEKLIHWMNYFEKNKKEASKSFWDEMHKGIQESLIEK